MPKMKTNRGAAKRFKKTASGFKRKMAYLRHILTKRTTKQKRRLRPKQAVHAHNQEMVAKMLGER